MDNWTGLPGDLNRAHMNPAELRADNVLREIAARKARNAATKKMSLSGHLREEKFARETRGLVAKPGGGVWTPVDKEESDEYRRLAGGADPAAHWVKRYNELSPEEKAELFSPEVTMELENMAARGEYDEGVLGDLERRNATLAGILAGETAERDKPNRMLGAHTPNFYHGANRFPTGAPVRVWEAEQRARADRNERALEVADEHMRGRVDETGERIRDKTGRPQFISHRFRPGEIIGDSPVEWTNLEQKIRTLWKIPPTSNDWSKVPPELHSAILNRSQQGLTDFANDIHANPLSRPTAPTRALFESLRGTAPTRKIVTDADGGVTIDSTPGTGQLAEIREGTVRGMVAQRTGQENLEAAREARMESPRGQKVSQRLSDERALMLMRAARAMRTPAENVEALRGANAVALANANKPPQNDMGNLIALMMAMNAGGGKWTPEQMENIMEFMERMRGGGAPGGAPPRFPIRLPPAMAIDPLPWWKTRGGAGWVD